MIVDSTALPEQVVADVLRSAFDSAGQRCSALRLLCLQQEIAGPVLTMLEGAIAELRLGDPASIATDVGPLIDEEALDRVQAHLQRMQPQIRCRSPMPAACDAGVFLPPTLIEIRSVAELTGEVFGPVLHVLRFDRQQLAQLIVDINATGFGLTMGIASRIEETIAYVAEHACVGNLYVNRNMIGAVVGLQPFGGRGLSGTGPKAGGPLYLHRLLRQRAAPTWTGQRAAVPAQLQALIDWLRTGRPSAKTVVAALSEPDRAALHARSQQDGGRTLLGAALELQGYVGERNQLRLQPIGLVRATARSLRAALAQLSAVLATGNRFMVDDPVLAYQLRRLLPPSLQTVIQDIRPDYDAVLIDAREAQGQPTWVTDIFTAEAAKDGPILPVLVSDDDGYALERLLREQTISTNTAAVGGDIRLLSLDDI